MRQPTTVAVKIRTAEQLEQLQALLAVQEDRLRARAAVEKRREEDGFESQEHYDLAYKEALGEVVIELSGAPAQGLPRRILQPVRIAVDVATAVELEQVQQLLVLQEERLHETELVERDRKYGRFETQEEFELAYRQALGQVTIEVRPALASEEAERLRVLEEPLVFDDEFAGAYEKEG